MAILLRCAPDAWQTDISAIDYAQATIYATPIPAFPYKRVDGSVQVGLGEYYGVPSFKFDVRGDDPLRYWGHRAEFTGGQGATNKYAWTNVTQTPSGTVTRWYSFAFRCESPWDKFDDSTQTCVLFQLHQQGDQASYGNPAPYNADDVVGPVLLGLFCQGNRWEIRNSYSSDPIVGAYSESLIYQRPIVTDEWQYVTIKMIFGWNNDGSTEIWWGRRKVYSAYGVNNAHNNWFGPFLKFGVYMKNHVDFNQPYPADRVVYHRGVIVGDASATFHDVQFDGKTELPISVGKAAFVMR